MILRVTRASRATKYALRQIRSLADAKVGPSAPRWSTEADLGINCYCLILGFATEYSTSVRKFTATYVNPIARMQPCTR